MTFSTVLQSALSEKRIVSLHFNPDNQSTFSVGYIVYFDAEWILLESIDTDGADEGYELRDHESLFRVDARGKYEDKIELLSKQYKPGQRELIISHETMGDMPVMEYLFQESKKNNRIIVVWTDDEYDSIIGYVTSYGESVVAIQEVDDYGNRDAEIYLKIESVRSLDIDSKKCRMLEFLHGVK